MVAILKRQPAYKDSKMVSSSHPAVVPARDRATGTSTKPLFGLVAVAVFVASALIALQLGSPPVPVPSGTPNAFSAEAAARHLAVIASKPHPLGSAQHDMVRDYILQTLTGLGYSPSVQRATATNKWAGAAGSIENIVARIEGRQNGKTLLLVAHYDSVPWGPGAADDGAAVAALLEVAGMLKLNSQLDRSVILLFSDGEEVGLLGARAFVEGHAWARDVGLVLNFEARGSRGPVIMFETSNRNSWMLSHFAQASSRPFSNSLAFEIYRLLPNDTDFTVFKAQGYSGLNFAFIDGLSNYHTELDSIANLDMRSLQQDGDYLLELAQRFGSTTAQDPKPGNAIYFDLFGRVLIHYSYIVAILLLILSAAMLMSVYVLGFSRKKIERRLLPGLGCILLLIIGSSAGAFLASWIVSAVAPRVRLGTLYHPGLYVSAYSILGCGLGTAFYSFFYRRLDSFNAAWAAMLIWFILGTITTVAMPGASFIFIWPLIFSLLGWFITLKFDLQGKTSGRIVQVIALLPGILMLVPLLQQLVTALTSSATIAVAATLALLSGLMAASIWPDVMPTRRLLPSLLTGGGLVLLVIAVAVSLADKEHPRRNSLFYALNADTGQQVWASYDDWMDPWTSKFFGQGNTRSALPDLFPGNNRKLLQAPANLPLISAPSLTVLEDNKTTNGRYIRLRLNSNRQAPELWTYISSASPVQDLQVNGVSSELLPVGQNTGVIHYHGLPRDGVELAFRVASQARIDLRLEDVTYNLADELNGSFRPRPSGYIPYPIRMNDSRIVMKSFSL